MVLDEALALRRPQGPVPRGEHAEGGAGARCLTALQDLCRRQAPDPMMLPFTRADQELT